RRHDGARTRSSLQDGSYRALWCNPGGNTMAKKVDVKTVDAVLATNLERVSIGDHSFLDRPPKVSEKALFQRFFKAEQAVLDGDESALAVYAKELARILNA